MIQGLRPFKYKNKCDLCGNLQDKDKREKIIAKKCFVLHEEDIDEFHEFCYIPIIEEQSFHIDHVRILGSMEYGKTRNDCFHDN